MPKEVCSQMLIYATVKTLAPLIESLEIGGSTILV